MNNLIPALLSTDNPALAQLLQQYINNKTKPPGSLGMLESLAKKIGLIQNTLQPVLKEPSVLIFAADHGIVEEGISAYPQSVTWQMVENFLARGAAINVFARQNGLRLQVVDAGVNHDFGVREELLDKKIAFGTQNFAKSAAMTREQCMRAMICGKELVASLSGNVLGFGEMGIGNTTSAAALMHMITGLPVAECVGAGTGLDHKGVQHKQQVIETAVAKYGDLNDSLDVLAHFGGFEIAMMVGAMLAAAERRMVLLIDGFIVTSALLIAQKMQPAMIDYCVFSHCSDESGHKRMLGYLGVNPLLQLNLRLGEGTGVALAYPLVQAAVNFLVEMATFESAQVSEKTPSA